MYAFLTGPMFWTSIAVFVIGLAARGLWYVRGLHWQLDRVAYRAHPKAGMRGAARSIFRWLLPFGTYGWRTQPFMTVAFFLFHTGAVLVPIFLLGHNAFLHEKIGMALPAMPQGLADLLTWAALAGIVMLVLRRIALPEVRILTTGYDYLILVVSAAPFVTGLMARYTVGDTSLWLLVHIVCGEILLISAPFTKLSHILLFFMSRGQLGMDYGIKRGGMKAHSKGMAW
ncbi:MAG: respiratory nitrate reductase subunit gamma [Desulfobacterales bacterium]|nr:respiratory nitrate reductase subunit gamma [Desulfobacterales bacterium]